MRLTTIGGPMLGCSMNSTGITGDLAVVDGDFDLILADLKSACFLPTCSEDPEGKIRCSEKAEVMQLQAWMKRWVKREREF
ncbi:hypothetical protein F2Q70_00002904 [Brassica cretica]|uniref:Uncharacterized protein n=1 Tax=Brassica cretica TaxID=69181 RepID=A0A8S9J0U8_BRACR|nr:hypothetical protein F2Q70_00002904 [Brassica cretica]